MADHKETNLPNVTPDRVKEFIETLDRLAVEKPAGFAAYMATCQSAMKMADFTQPEASKKS
jgi:hypothetical protein